MTKPRHDQSQRSTLRALSTADWEAILSTLSDDDFCIVEEFVHNQAQRNPKANTSDS